MTVNMVTLLEPESGTKVLKMTPPWNGSADMALTSKNHTQQSFWSA